MKLLVCRTGSPLYCDPVKATSPKGEADTLPFLEWCAQNEKVEAMYFGRTVSPELCPVPCIEPDLSEVGEFCSLAEMKERLEPCWDKIREFAPDVIVNYQGAPPTWSNPDNPRFSSVQAMAVRYCLPALYTMHMLEIPRVVVMTDPKCYPRDGEMSTCWPLTRPVAVLSQEDTIFKRTIIGKDWNVHAAYAGCEYWLTWNWEPLTPFLERDPLLLMGHSHFKTSRIPGGREDIYARWFDNVKCDIIGTGWEGWEQWLGTVPTLNDVRELLRHYHGGPFLPQKPGFNSTKPRIYAMSGACPMPYGTGLADLTYDRDARILPLDHPCRIREGETLGEAWSRLSLRELNDGLALTLENTRPDFTKLLSCVNDIKSGRDTLTEEWARTYGGYLPC